MTLRRIWASLFTLSLIAPLASRAQTPTPRLASTIGNSGRVALSGSLSPRIKTATDQGVLRSEQPINGITLVFNRSAAQEADLQALLAAQQDPASPLYHHWLTPDQFGARFGMAESDLANAQSWLQSQGFAIDSVTRSRDRITFSGTAGQVKEAFGAALHTFIVSGETHFAPASELTLPAELAPTVAAVLHLSDFRPKPHLIRNKNVVRPAFTSSQTQAHYLTPLDVATQYNVSAVYNAGFNGAGQAIAVVGQTYIQTSDVQHFQTAAGLPSNLPNLVLVPNTGGSAISAGDEAESDLDVEYTSGMARGAQIYLRTTCHARGVLDI